MFACSYFFSGHRCRTKNKRVYHRTEIDLITVMANGAAQRRLSRAPVSKTVPVKMRALDCEYKANAVSLPTQCFREVTILILH
jgi:hypothetical protein